MKLISPSFRRTKDFSLAKFAEAMQRAAECQEFTETAPIIYIPDDENQNSYMVRLQSVTGPLAHDSASVLARRILAVLADHGIKASARIPGSEDFLKARIVAKPKDKHA